MNFHFPTMCVISILKIECVGMDTLVNGLYVLEIHELVRDRNAIIATTSSEKRSRHIGVDLKHLWHLKLGHIDEKRINELAMLRFIYPVGVEPESTCESCLLKKKG